MVKVDIINEIIKIKPEYVSKIGTLLTKDKAQLEDILTCLQNGSEPQIDNPAKKTLHSRQIDSLGRIVIPKKIRQKLDIKPFDFIIFEEINGLVILKKVN